jgi:hypothetical protein
MTYHGLHLGKEIEKPIIALNDNKESKTYFLIFQEFLKSICFGGLVGLDFGLT